MRNLEQCRFAKSHEWIDADGTVGITDHAQKEITDIVFIELPKPGKILKAGEPVAVIESVKAAFDIYAPVSGTVSLVNEAVAKNPALVNQSPFEDGWLFKLEASNGAERDQLMTHAAYQTFVESDAS